MASGPYFDRRRGTYTVQWFDGRKWTRATVYKVPGWKDGMAPPKKVPPQALAAVQVYAEKEKAARLGRALDPTLSVADFLDAYALAYSADRADASAAELKKAHRHFKAWCAAAKVAKVGQVTAAVCQRWVDARSAETSRKTGRPITPARISQERALLMGAWTRAVRLGELPENPWARAEVPGLDRARKARRKRPSWTPEEFARLLEAARRPWVRDLLVVGTQTGLRISALAGLQWRDIHWARPGKAGFGEVEVRPELDKAGRGYRVPMSRTCHDVLARRLAMEGEDKPVLAGADGRRVTVNAAGKAILRACGRAGLPEMPSPNHAMRRTFGRWAVLGHLTGKPIPLYVVSRWLGHHSVSMTESYLDIRQEESMDWMADDRADDGEVMP